MFLQVTTGRQGNPETKYRNSLPVDTITSSKKITINRDPSSGKIRKITTGSKKNTTGRHRRK